MSSLFDMGQFGGFIWVSYAIAAIALGWMFMYSWASAKMLAKNLARMTQDDTVDINNNQD
ncbi:heme exporter protein CcmD [Alphaproteobacteria bacterium]|jgi:heme exporter protein CcmD|nr:heme exporter protein CcmD [Alphaproteobacteria bacterium]